MMDGSKALARILKQIAKGRVIKLFLDYDGTLVPIAPRPEQAVPSPALLELLASLAGQPSFDITVLSGRHLASLRAMLPVQGLTLIGIYGVEIQFVGHEPWMRVEQSKLRPVIERLLKSLESLIRGYDGFWLEDKGVAVALHARFAHANDASVILQIAEHIAARLGAGASLRILGGERFLEVAPKLAHKGRTVEWLLQQDPVSDALIVYFGDDDKDEEAFRVVREHNGIPIIVGARSTQTQALARLPNSEVLYGWLQSMLNTAAGLSTLRETESGQEFVTRPR